VGLFDWLHTGERLRALDARVAAAERDAAAARAEADARLRAALAEAAAHEAALRGKIDELAGRAAAQQSALDALAARAASADDAIRAARLTDAERHALAGAAAAHPPFPSLPRAGYVAPEPWFYAAFEALFRGSREEIAARLGVHLTPAVAAARACDDRPLIDIGCGRGEWLGLVTGQGLHAIGIDVNPDMVAACRALGLDAHLADGVAHLRAVAAQAVSVVTAFHVVEHLPINAIVALLVETERVLAPGGLVILETPNPDNLVVGANTFWLDPSHLRPLPPRLLRFCVEAAGLVVEEVVPLGPDPQVAAQAATESWPPGVAHALGGARDYAIVARKARA